MAKKKKVEFFEVEIKLKPTMRSKIKSGQMNLGDHCVKFDPQVMEIEATLLASDECKYFMEWTEPTVMKPAVEPVVTPVVPAPNVKPGDSDIQPVEPELK